MTDRSLIIRAATAEDGAFLGDMLRETVNWSPEWKKKSRPLSPDINLPTPVLAIALPLWVFGLAWAGLGWRRYVEPLWVTIPCGVILALMAPSFAAGHYGWMYAIGIATAAAAMAASVPLRNVPLLALGALAMFGYVTSVAARYLHDSLGVPSALAITGVLIIGLAVVSARLMREPHPPKPEQMDAEEPPPVTLSPKPTEPGADKPSRPDLPKASYVPSGTSPGRNGPFGAVRLTVSDESDTFSAWLMTSRRGMRGC